MTRLARTVRPAPPPAATDAPDVAVAALPLFGKLRDAIRAVRAPARHPWRVPPLFFFDRRLQAEWEAVKPRAEELDRLPTPLADLTDDALTVLGSSTVARHAARAVPGLAEAVAAVRAVHPRLRELADLLALADDEVVRVVFPAARAGWRVVVRGVADVSQFHVLLADAVAGVVPGPRPDPQVVAAYRDRPADPDAAVAAARFQCFRPDALRPDGTLPGGFAAADHWLWGPEPLGQLPRIDGERVVLLAEPTVRTTWEAARRLPRVTGELDVVQAMTAAEVADWVGERTGHRPEWAGATAARAA